MSMFEARTEESERQRKQREEEEKIREFAQRRAELLTVQSERALTDEERLELSEISRQLPMSRAAYKALVQRREKLKARARRKRLEAQQEIREWKAEVRREAPKGYDITFREEEGMIRAEFTALPYEGVLSERAIEEYYGVDIEDLPYGTEITDVTLAPLVGPPRRGEKMPIGDPLIQLETSFKPYPAYFPRSEEALEAFYGEEIEDLPKGVAISDVTLKGGEIELKTEFRPYTGVLSKEALEAFYDVNLTVPEGALITGVSVGEGLVVEYLPSALSREIVGVGEGFKERGKEAYLARQALAPSLSSQILSGSEILSEIAGIIRKEEGLRREEAYRTYFTEQLGIRPTERYVIDPKALMGYVASAIEYKQMVQRLQRIKAKGVGYKPTSEESAFLNIPEGYTITKISKVNGEWQIEAKPPSWKEKTLSGYILGGGEAALEASPLWLELGLKAYAKTPSWEVGLGAVGGGTLLYGAAQYSAFLSGVVGTFESTASFVELAGRSIGATILEGKPQLVPSKFVTAPPTPVSSLISYVLGEEPLPDVPSELAVAYTVGGITGLVAEYKLMSYAGKKISATKVTLSKKVTQKLLGTRVWKTYMAAKEWKQLKAPISFGQSRIGKSLIRTKSNIARYFYERDIPLLSKYVRSHTVLAKATIGMPTGAERRVSEYLVQDILGTKGVTGIYAKPFPAVTKGLQTYGLDIIATSEGLKEIFRPLRQEELVSGFTPSAIRETAQIKPLPKGWEQLVTQPSSFVKTPFTMTSGYPLKPTEVAYMIEHRVSAPVEQAIIGDLSYQKYTWTMGRSGKGFFEKPQLPLLSEVLEYIETKPIPSVMGKTPLVYTVPEMGEFELSLPWYIVAGSREELQLVAKEFLKRYQIPKKGLVVKYADLEELYGLHTTTVSAETLAVLEREILLAYEQEPKELTKTLLHELGHDYFRMKYPAELVELLEVKGKEEELAERFEEKLIKRVKHEEVASVLDYILKPRILSYEKLEALVKEKIRPKTQYIELSPLFETIIGVKQKKTVVPWWRWRGEAYPFTLTISKEWAKTLLAPYPTMKYEAYPTKATAPTIRSPLLDKVKMKQPQRLTVPLVAPFQAESPILSEIMRVTPILAVEQPQRQRITPVSLLVQLGVPEYYEFPPPPPPPQPIPPYAYWQDMPSEFYGGFGALWGQQWWFKQHPILGTSEATKHIFGASPKHKSSVASYILGGS